MRLGPIINGALAPLGLSLVRKNSNSFDYHPRYDIGPDLVDGLDKNTRKALNLIEYTKKRGSSYSAAEFENAYHTIQLAGHTFAGQRDPRERLEDVPFDFTGASVLDIGCNQGGMLFAVSDRIAHGIGIDYDHRMVNAANRIRSHLSLGNLDFYVFDLEQENLKLIHNLIPSNRVDIVFLLSVCMWLKNWQDVLRGMVDLSDSMLFESNGSPAQQDEQERMLHETFRSITKVRDRSTDDPKQPSRRLYLCSNHT